MGTDSEVRVLRELGPFGVAADGAGNVFVPDYGNTRIEKAPTPATTMTWGRLKSLYH